MYEQIQLWGSGGTFILNRFRPTYDNRPALVAHQLADGSIVQPDLSGAAAQPSAPTAAFIRLLSSMHNATEHAAARAAVKSMGEESLETISVIEAIYKSANEHARIGLHHS
ncbi:MAG: hypothetical protein M3Z08_23100 [Chloroflexota bacterium]|nr:hypothetical protein [Chloroflexota bacterium]